MKLKMMISSVSPSMTAATKSWLTIAVFKTSVSAFRTPSVTSIKTCHSALLVSTVSNAALSVAPTTKSASTLKLANKIKNRFSPGYTSQSSSLLPFFSVDLFVFSSSTSKERKRR